MVADVDEVTDEIAGALRDCRVEAGMSQAEVARRMPYTKSALSMMERCTRHPPLATLLRCAQVLGAEVSITVTSKTGKVMYRS